MVILSHKRVISRQIGITVPLDFHSGSVDSVSGFSEIRSRLKSSHRITIAVACLTPLSDQVVFWTADYVQWIVLHYD
jgi:hypothetical protein